MNSERFYNPGEYHETKIDLDRQEAYDEGIDAFDQGFDLKDNPYKNNITLSWAWHDGFVNRRDGSE